MLTKARLNELLNYDAETGVFTWAISRGRSQAGSVAGAVCHGYIRIHVDGKNYAAHRLAWLASKGTWPSDEIDHIDRDRGNNAISNLREATRKQNNENLGLRELKTSEFRGVHFSKDRNKWVAQIRVSGKAKHLGVFDCEADAAVVAAAARRKHYTHSPFNPQAIGGAS